MERGKALKQAMSDVGPYNDLITFKRKGNQHADQP
jgi:hypothetical protein